MRDEQFDEYVQERIRKLCGLDEMPPEERELWDAIDRVEEAARRDQEAAKTRILGNAKAIVAWINENPAVLDEIMPGAGAVMAEHGLRFVWEET